MVALETVDSANIDVEDVVTSIVEPSPLAELQFVGVSVDVVEVVSVVVELLENSNCVKKHSAKKQTVLFFIKLINSPFYKIRYKKNIIE